MWDEFWVHLKGSDSIHALLFDFWSWLKMEIWKIKVFNTSNVEFCLYLFFLFIFVFQHEKNTTINCLSELVLCFGGGSGACPSRVH